jgi:hypothetical protein
MDFDDILENKNKHHENYRRHEYHDDDRYSHDSHHSNSGHNGHLIWLNLFEKIRNNNKLKLLILLAGIFILAIIIGLILVLWPLLMKLFTYLTENGLKGILDGITGILDAILKGSGK